METKYVDVTEALAHVTLIALAEAEGRKDLTEAQVEAIKARIEELYKALLTGKHVAPDPNDAYRWVIEDGSKGPDALDIE